jgi:pyruvate dehydrogenase E2 component (dihydrolipoamide acetyltransferase)
MLHEYKLPSLGDGVSGKVTEILVKTGDKVSLDQIVLVVGTDKVDAEMPIDAEGIVEEIFVKKGDEVTEGTLVMKVKTVASSSEAVVNTPAATATIPAAATTSQITAAPATATAPATAPASATATLRTSPLARKRAKEFGVNLSDIRPAEGASRLSYKDVVDFVKKKLDTGGGSSMGGGNMPRRPLPDFSKFGDTERKALTNVGLKTSEAMSYSTNTIPHAYISEKADITRLEALRQQYKEQVKTAGGQPHHDGHFNQSSGNFASPDATIQQQY